MKPYYEDDYCTIYHGDCREILPELNKSDLVLTDPPYGIGVDRTMASQSGTQYGKSLTPKKTYQFTGWDDSVIDQALLNIIISYGKNACIWGGELLRNGAWS